MAGKRVLKRLFLGKLVPFPAVLDDGMAEYVPPTAIAPEHPVTGYKILFAVGRQV